MRRWFKENDNLYEQPSRGHWTTEIQNQVHNEANQEYNVAVSRNTVRNRLHEINLHSRRLIKCPSFTRNNYGIWLEWWEHFQNLKLGWE